MESKKIKIIQLVKTMIDIEILHSSKMEQVKLMAVLVVLWGIIYKFVVDRVKIAGLKKKDMDDF